MKRNSDGQSGRDPKASDAVAFDPFLAVGCASDGARPMSLARVSISERTWVRIASLMLPQAAISSIVRRQPSQSRVRESIRHTEVQGERSFAEDAKRGGLARLTAPAPLSEPT